VEYAVVLIGVLVGAFVQSVAGFGAGMVAMAILPLVLPMTDAVPVVAVVCAVINGSILMQVRQHVERSKALPLAVGVVLGVPIGILGLKSLDPSVLKLVLGVILVGYAAQGLSSGGGRRLHLSDRWGYLAGLACGVLGGAFNTGGPPVVLYVTLQDWAKDTVKASLQAAFVTVSLTQLPGYAIAGVLGRQHLVMSAIALPALGLGLWGGTKVYDRIDAATFRRVVLIGMAIMGVVFIAREIPGLLP